MRKLGRKIPEKAYYDWKLKQGAETNINEEI